MHFESFQNNLSSTSGRGVAGEGFRAIHENKETPDPGTVAKDGRRTPRVNKPNLAAFVVWVNQIIDENLSV